MVLLRQTSQTRLKRNGDLGVRAKIEHNEPEAAGADELVRSARHGLGTRNSDNDKRIEIHPALSDIRRIEGALFRCDPRHRFTLLLCLKHQPARQRE